MLEICASEMISHEFICTNRPGKIQPCFEMVLFWGCKKILSSLSEAEELYQKRILTITGICIALLVVGIMCVVAYCKTK